MRVRISIFIITTIICGIGWLKDHVSCMALVYYMKKKGYTLPNNREIKECTEEAAKHLIK